MTDLSKIQLYQKNAIQSSGKLASVLLLLDTAVILLKEAHGQVPKRNQNIIKVQNILTQLEMSLNTKNGNMAESFFVIYDFLFFELQNRDTRGIETGIQFLEALKQTLRKVQKRGL